MQEKVLRFISVFSISAEFKSPGSIRLVLQMTILRTVTAGRIPCLLQGSMIYRHQLKSGHAIWVVPKAVFLVIVLVHFPWNQSVTFPPLSSLGQAKTCDLSCLTWATGSTPKSKSEMNILVTSANQLINKYLLAFVEIPL